MKTIRILILAVMVILSVNNRLIAQYTLQTAKYSSFTVNHSNMNPSDSIPPFSSILPSGPYYGNMSIHQRPMWFYYPSCISAASCRIGFNANMAINNPQISTAIWGPFDSISGITLAQLDSTRLLLSYNGTVLSGTGGYSPDLPHLDTGKVYILVITTSDTISTLKINAYPDITPTHFYTPTSAYTDVCNLCNGKATYFEGYKGICYLGVDTPSNYPHMVWNKDAGDIGIFGYYVTRKNSMNLFDTLTFITYNNGLSEFIDTTVSAIQQKRTYRILPVDSCNQTENSILYYSYGTYYLQANPGLNNQVNLILDYSGLIYYIDVINPVSYIWRSVNGNPPVLIDSMAFGNMPFISYYTDINVPAGPVKYTIEVRSTISCNPMKMSVSYTSVLSNVAGVVVLGVQEAGELSSLSVSPNPVSNNEVKIHFGQQLKDKADVYFISVDGKIADQVSISRGTDNYNYSTANLNPGIYQVRIESRGYKKVMKLVVL